MASVPSTGSPRSQGKPTPSPAGVDAGHKGLSGAKVDVSLCPEHHCSIVYTDTKVES